MSRIGPRPSAAHGLIQEAPNGDTWVTPAHWSDDLDELLSEAQRWCPDGWQFSLTWGRLFSDQPMHWTAGWCTMRGPGDESLWGHGPTVGEAIARLLDQLGRLPR